MSEYNPFVKCLHPVSIINQYTGKSLVVPCQRCSACRNNKDLHYSTLCQLESTSHRYTMFVTLTFDDDNIPYFEIIQDDGCFLFVDMNRDCGNILYQYEDTPPNRKYLTYYSKRVKMKQGFSFLYKRDAQLFIKRLRKYIYGRTKEKIRYFCCGEYGPDTFRAHFHFNFWFDDPKTAQVFEQALYSSWRYGNINWSSSTGKSSNYVAGYLNSNSKLPYFLTEGQLSQFCLHSNRLGEKILRTHKEEVYECPFECFNHRCLNINGSVKELSPWRSFTAQYFPRCRAYNTLTTHERFAVYTLYHVLSVKTGLRKVSEISKEVLRWLFDVPIPFVLKRPFGMCPYSTILELCDYRQYEKIFQEPEEQREKFYNQVYNIIRTSFQFCTFVCDHPTSFEFNKKLKIIDNYYSDLSLKKLNEHLEYQQSLEYQNEGDYHQFYDNYIDKKLYKDNPVFQAYKLKNDRLVLERVKHKEQNDKNNIFINS